MSDAVPTHIWLIFPADADVAPTRYTNKRFLEVAESEGCRIEIIDPRAIADDILAAPKTGQKPLAGLGRDLPQIALARSGARMGKKGRQLMTRLSERGVSVYPKTDALRRAGDKLKTAERLLSEGIPTPDTFALESYDLDASPLGYPVVVKRSRGSKGVQVALCQTRADVETAAQMLPGRSPLLVQRFISASFGRDIRVFVSGGRVLAAIERQGAEGEFRSNIAVGGQARLLPADAKRDSLALDAARAMELDFAGVDILSGKDDYLICEVNAAPGFEAIEEVSGIDVAREMLRDARLLHNAEGRGVSR